ncbi:MAG: precorrin-8X methylmutase [Bacillota bacterium]
MEIIWNPQEIESKSMKIIEEYLTGYTFTSGQKAVVKRVVHTTGDPSIVSSIVFHPAAVVKGLEALRQGADVFTDVNMLKAGVNDNKVRAFGGQVCCGVADAQTVEAARDWGITRAAAAMRLFGRRLDGAVVAVGNAPTALFEVIDLITKGTARPALIIGTPVGFVGAAESKELLVEKNLVPYITVKGTRGGSPIAASMLNALLYFEGDEKHV